MKKQIKYISKRSDYLNICFIPTLGALWQFWHATIYDWKHGNDGMGTTIKFENQSKGDK